MFRLTIFSLKNSFRKKSIAFLAILGIAIGITLQISMTSLSDSIDNSFNQVYNDLIGQIEIREANKVLMQSQLPDDIISTIQNSNVSSRIKTISPEIVLPVTLLNNYLDDMNYTNLNLIKLNGINLDDFKQVSTELDELTSGSRYFDNDNEVVISDSFYNSNTTLFELGNQINLYIDENNTYNLTIVGIAKPTEGTALSRGTEGTFGTMNVWMSIDTAINIRSEILANDSTAIGTPRFIHYESSGLNSSLIRSDSLSLIKLLTDAVNSDEVENIIDQLDILLDRYDEKFIILSKAQFLDSIVNSQDELTIFLDAVGFIAVLAGSMAIIISQLVGVESRMKEFGILKATGWKNIHLMYNVLIESITMGLIGAVFGIISSKIIAYVVNNQLQSENSSNQMIVTIPIMKHAVVLSIIIGILGGLYPSIKAASVVPIEVIRGK